VPDASSKADVTDAAKGESQSAPPRNFTQPNVTNWLGVSWRFLRSTGAHPANLTGCPAIWEGMIRAGCGREKEMRI